MIEPEMAFYDLEDNMNLAEEFIKYIIKYAIDNNREDLEFLAQRLADEEKQLPQDKRSEMGLIGKLEFVLNNNFERITYTEAIDILKESNHNKKKKFQYEITGWGMDLQSEHERYLVEKHFKKPVILSNYPKEIKAFYMRQNEDGKQLLHSAPALGKAGFKEKNGLTTYSDERNAYSRRGALVVLGYKTIWYCAPCRLWSWF
jgi:asparaginyl-tRNA synthetase